MFLAAGALSYSYYQRSQAEREFARQAALATEEARHMQQTVVLYSQRTVPRGEPFSAALEGFGIDAATTAQVVASAERVFNFRQFRAGNRLQVGRSLLGELREVNYSIDPARVLAIAPSDGSFRAEVETLPSKTETAGVGGELHGSLFESISEIGEKPELALRLAEIFAYDLDFYTDPRPGDTFRVVVEKTRLASGETISYGHILAAEYNNDGKIYRAVLFHDPYGQPAYYTADGKALKRAFLHSPLKFAAPISSHFSEHRFHPILKVFRPHLGTDYAAPIGTPVQALGDGRVVFAGRKGGSGNLVEIKHSNGYETYYMHLSRILVRQGQTVAMGKTIGLVGMTGLATGPHLDFRIQHNGEFENFERLHLPSADPISRREWATFAAARDRAIALLPEPEQFARAANAPAAAPSTPATPR